MKASISKRIWDMSIWPDFMGMVGRSMLSTPCWNCIYTQRRCWRCIAPMTSAGSGSTAHFELQSCLISFCPHFTELQAHLLPAITSLCIPGLFYFMSFILLCTDYLLVHWIMSFALSITCLTILLTGVSSINTTYPVICILTVKLLSICEHW